MATVYLAEDLRHERKVALKVLKPELAAVVGAERFLTEIKTTANLQHPHILPLHDSGEADGFLFFVTPYIEGDTLRDRIDREKQLGIEEALKITEKVASALDHAHKHGVVHRDIKPGNILLSAEGEPTVADFGIALAVAHAGGGRVTETGLSVGTPHYMSPEQATGDRDVDPRTDVYALGSVLYEMLTGDPPYQGSTAQAVLAKILTDPAPAPTKVRVSIPPNVDAAIRKALEKLPADRFASAQDFATALADPGFRHGEEVGEGAAVGAGFPRWMTIGLAGTAALFGIVAAWALLRPDPAQPVFRFTLNWLEDVQPFSENGLQLAISPDGSRVVFVEGSAGGTQLWQWPLDQLSPTPVSGTEDARNPRFSPDGTTVAFNRNDALVTVSLTGAPPLTVVSDSVQNGGLAWGPDGNLYFRKPGLGMWRTSANGGQEEELSMLAEGETGHLWPDVLPKAGGILFTRDIGSPLEDEIAVLSLETGEIRVLLQGAMARYAHSGHIVYTGGDGTLYMAPFDQDRMEVTGPSRTYLEGIRVNQGSASYFALSETGSLVYQPGFAAGSGGVGALTWIDRDGLEQLLDPAFTGLFETPAFSPDGRRVAVQRQLANQPEDIWVYDLEQGTSTRLTFEGRNLQPFWSPDGSEVGFSSTRDGLFSLYSRRADLSQDARLLLADPNDGLLEGTWTPDGRWLTYRRGSTSQTAEDILDLWYAAPQPDSTPHVILDTPASESNPSLSPDGDWLGYTSDESGRTEVYVRPFPGPGGQSVVSVNGGLNPKWASNGREIFYLGLDGSFNVATVRTDPDFAVESRERLNARASFWGPTMRHWDLTPDDLRVLAVGGSGGAQALDLILVQNFFEELRQVVPD